VKQGIARVFETQTVLSLITFLQQRKLAMLHTAHILLQSRPFDKNSIAFKFSDLVYDVLAQLKLEHLDKLIYSVDKYASDDKVKNGLIDGLIGSRCNLLKEKFSELSINEQFYVLAHLNLELLTPNVEEPSQIFASLVHSLVREMITTGQ